MKPAKYFITSIILFATFSFAAPQHPSCKDNSTCKEPGAVCCPIRGVRRSFQNFFFFLSVELTKIIIFRRVVAFVVNRSCAAGYDLLARIFPGSLVVHVRPCPSGIRLEIHTIWAFYEVCMLNNQLVILN